jgi:hypothetical protein
LPKWNPKDLLNPKAAATSTAKANGLQDQLVPRTNTSLTPGGTLEFVFSSSNENDMDNPSAITSNLHPAATDTGASPPTHGGLSQSYRHMAMLQRMKNVQDRSDVASMPSPKRRKVDGEDEADKAALAKHYRGGGSSGMLDEHLKERKKEQDAKNNLEPSAIMVDLTEGTVLVFQYPKQ